MIIRRDFVYLCMMARKLFPVLVCVVSMNVIMMPCAVFAYEDYPNVHISEILAPEIAQSVQHRVEDVAVTDGTFQFQVESDFGQLRVASMALLRERVREIKILAKAINQFAAQDDGLSQEIRGQLIVSADSAIDIITRPVTTATDLAGQLADNLNETLTDPLQQTEKKLDYAGTESTDPIITTHKRNIASQWILDVYSTNPKVQEFLNVVAKKRSAGKITAGTPSLSRRVLQPLKVADTALEQQIYLLLKRKNTAELNAVNAQLLVDINIGAELRSRFLQHPVYSPRHKTRICHYLHALTGVRNRGAFIEAMLAAQDEGMALSFEQIAMMLQYYHQQINTLQKLHLGDPGLQAISADNQLLHISTADLIYWMENTERLYKDIAEQAKQSGFNGWSLITAGIVTDEARSELQKMRFSIREKFIY